jgi:hypothetical protein
MSDPDGCTPAPQPASAPGRVPEYASTPDPESEKAEGHGYVPGPEGEPSTKQETIIDAIADLLQLLVNWLRQEAAALVHDKLLIPLQTLGLTLSSAAAAACLATLGLGFLSVSLLLLLARWLGWIGALALIGLVLLAGSVAFTVVKIRSIQK